MLSSDAATRDPLFADRDPRLFTEFLPTGYLTMTLSSVPERFRRCLLAAKLSLGMFITLLDDFADNPRQHNPHLLQELHRVAFHWKWVCFEGLGERERRVLTLARELAEGALFPLVSLPNYRLLQPLLEFDLDQFHNANRYAELATRLRHLPNVWELRLYGPFNMGMIAIGTMDLIASPGFVMEELGAIRGILGAGQRIGRICNMLVTLERERAEGDVTNELLVGPENQRELREERESLFAQLSGRERELRSFSVRAYIRSLRALQRLHERMEGSL